MKKEKPKRKYYVYRITNIKTSEFYIGYRGTRLENPLNDLGKKYFTSCSMKPEFESRPKYETRQVMLSTSMTHETALQLVKNAPIDPIKPLQLIIREYVPVRKDTQNALMWSGALKDIATQAWVDGRQFSIDVWHHYFKVEHLPETYTEGITKEGYRKWDMTPSGERVLVGSTTQLTTKGFSEYLERIHADGANMGVLFKSVRSR